MKNTEKFSKNKISFSEIFKTYIRNNLSVKNAFKAWALILFFLFVNNSYAQESHIYRIPDNQKAMSTLFDRSDLARAHTLIYDMHSNLYVRNNSIKQYNKKTPVVLILKDFNSFSLLENQNSLFNNIELIRIDIKTQSDLNKGFDVSALKGFNNLKYILIYCHFKVDKSQIKLFVRNVNPGITIFYKYIRLQ